MTVYDALGTANREARHLKYSHDKLKAIRLLGGDLFPYMTPEEMRRERQGLCRDLAIYVIDTAIRLSPGTYYLVIGDTPADQDADPDHAWVEATGDPGETWWADPTNEDDVHRPTWFTRLLGFTALRVYRYALNDKGQGMFVERLDERRSA